MSRVNWIVHLDGDAFAVAVERRRGRAPLNTPVIVSHGTEGHAAVSCASYEARARGVTNGASLSWARWRLGEEAVFLPCDLLAYEAASREVFEWLCRAVPLVEMAGMDDFYLDLTGCERWCGGNVALWATKLLQRLQKEVGLPFSAGVATSKSVANVATRVAKPGGLAFVPPGAESDFLRPMELELMSHVDPALVRQLKEFGCRCVGEALDLGHERLCLLFGTPKGERLWGLLQGTWQEPVRPTHLATRVEAEYVFEPETCAPAFVAAGLRWVVENVAWKLRQSGLRCALMIFTGIYCDGAIVRRCGRPTYPTAQSHELAEIARPWVGVLLRRRVRLRRLHLEARTESGVEMDDFFEEQRLARTGRLYKALDHVRARYGMASLVSATALPVVQRLRGWSIPPESRTAGKRKRAPERPIERRSTDGKRRRQ